MQPKKDGKITMYKSFVFSRTELAFLLAEAGLNTFYGFDLLVSEFKQRDALLFINKLVRSGIVGVNENSLRFNTEVSTIINCLANSKNVVVVYPGSSFCDISCCYSFGDNSVVLRVCNDSVDKIRLTMVKTFEVYDLLNSNSKTNRIDSADDDFVSSDYNAKKTVDEISKCFPKADLSVFRSFDNIDLIIGVVEKNTGNLNRIGAVISEPDIDYFAEIFYGESEICIYSEERAERFFSEVLL